MTSSTDYHPTSFARSEQSLRRSLSAIHRDASPSFPSTPANNDLVKDRCGGHGNASRCERMPPSNRDTSPTNAAAPFPFSETPALPFSRDGSSRPLPLRNKKSSRRQYPYPDELAVKLTKEKQQERQTKRRMTANHSRTRRRTFATFMPSTAPTSISLDDSDKNQTREGTGFRSDYSLGEALRCPSHVVLENTTERAILAVSSLNVHDFAFVKRSDGSYSYAIFAYRSVESIKGANDAESELMEECMTFVMSDTGSTKMVRKRHWSKRVFPIDSQSQEQNHSN